MHHARRTLERLGAPHVLVLGDIMLDRYVWGNAERISPEAPVLVLRSDFDEVRPGGAASVAHLLAALDAKVSVSGVIGQDSDGRTLRRLFDESEIDHSLVLDDAWRVTTCKERIVGRATNHPHQIVRVDREDDRPISRALESKLVVAIIERLHEFDVVLISDYRKGLCSRGLLRSIITAAARTGIPTLIDPARGVDYARYRGASLLKPNRLEAQIASGVTIRCPDDALTAGRLLREQSRVETVLVTLDSEGMALIPAGGKGRLLTTHPRKVHDVTGAGDMALAMLGLCRAGGIGWFNSSFYANIAAGLQVEKFGISPITRDEVWKEVGGKPSGRTGRIVSLNELLSLLEAHRHNRQRIVFTNGCFDLFHVGHVRCLDEAAALGDVLIVAINSDASVRRLKGLGRPVVRQQDRAAIVAALGCVDYVIVFGSDTPDRLLRMIKPDVLAKGGSSSIESVTGREIVAQQGGEVRITGKVIGVSTSHILERIHTKARD